MSEIAVSALAGAEAGGLVDGPRDGPAGHGELRADLAEAAGAVKKVTGARCLTAAPSARARPQWWRGCRPTSF
jgi:hypothetical protein